MTFSELIETRTFKIFGLGMISGMILAKIAEWVGWYFAFILDMMGKL